MTYDPSSRSTREPLADWAAIMRQLRHREIIRTNNNPISDIAEAIVAEHYDASAAASASAAGTCCCPAASDSRSRRCARPARAPRRNLSPIRDTDYDAVIVVIFDEDALPHPPFPRLVDGSQRGV